MILDITPNPPFNPLFRNGLVSNQVAALYVPLSNILIERLSNVKSETDNRFVQVGSCRRTTGRALGIPSPYEKVW